LPGTGEDFGVPRSSMRGSQVPPASGAGSRLHLSRSVGCADRRRGAGYSIFPESALRYLGADMGIHGEGEAVFPALLHRIAKGVPVSGLPGLDLPGQRPAGTFARNLDDLPLPEPGLWIPSVSNQGQFWIPVQSRRGCPLDCSFCSTSAIEGRPIRRHSPETVVKWLEQLFSSQRVAPFQLRR